MFVVCGWLTFRDVIGQRVQEVQRRAEVRLPVGVPVGGEMQEVVQLPCLRVGQTWRSQVTEYIYQSSGSQTISCRGPPK